MVAQGEEIILSDVSPPAGPLDIHRLTMVNLVAVDIPGGGTLRGHVRSQLLDGNQNLVVSLRSLPLNLNTGQQVSYTAIPWTGNPRFGTGPVAGRLRSAGRLYRGDYLVCHEFVSEADGRVVKRQCHEKQAALDINFSLIYPLDESVVQDVRPQLAWENVASYGLSVGGISYDIRLVELHGGQSAAAALDVNPTLLHQRGHATSSLLFPAALPPLQRGHRYAWTVIVRQNNDEILTSEPWTFTVGEPGPPRDAPPPPTESYVMPSTRVSTRVHHFGRAIHLGFDNNEGLSRLTYTIDRIGGKSESVSALPIIDELSPGLNTLDIPTNNMRLEEGAVYRLSIATPRRQFYTLQFRYDPTL